MKKSLLILCSLLTLNAFADCADLNGSYSLVDPVNQCSVSQSDGTIFVDASVPHIKLMAKPGPRYGYLLQNIGVNDLKSITIVQNDCKEIEIVSNTNSETSLKIQTGEFPYFGARSPIFVNTKLGKEQLTQSMLITKYTTISNGVKTVYKNLKYSSSIQKKGQKLIMQAGIKFGKKNKKFETVSCIFTSN